VGRTRRFYAAAGGGGLVVEQSPPAGAPLAPGGSVDLFLAEETAFDTYVMPDLVDLDYERVRAFFVARGFRLGRVGYESYAGVRPGTVVRQFPQAGHPLRRGDVISLGVVAPDSGGAVAGPAPVSPS
jgi:beta-lactam-binding protein with PASTA domain